MSYSIGAPLENDSIVFVSFNYDLLLERALESSWAFDAHDLGSYLRHDRVSVLKPHGSIQWHWRLPNLGGISGDMYIHGATSIEAALLHGMQDAALACEATAPFEQLGSHPEFPPMIPALALPVDGKSEFIWPPEQAAKLAALAVGSVSRVLTIGWRAMEPHFLDLLRPLVRGDARCLVVAGGDRGDAEGGQAMSRLREKTDVQPTGWKVFGQGFSALLRDRDAMEWLFAPPT